MMEKTLVLIKPDGVVRGLSGKIITRFEEAGLKVVAMKMLKPTKELAGDHYPFNMEWAQAVWNKTKKGYDEKGLQMKDTAEQLGKRIRSFLMDYITDKPVIAMVVEGNEAISSVRKIVGATAPYKADPGSIRGKYSTDSYEVSDTEKRPIRNLIHASEDTKTAEAEIKVWFKKGEILEYKRVEEAHVY